MLGAEVLSHGQRWRPTRVQTRHSGDVSRVSACAKLLVLSPPNFHFLLPFIAQLSLSLFSINNPIRVFIFFPSEQTPFHECRLTTGCKPYTKC
ncbi:hypothetical protein RJT34_17805 [Clitoria ternatea]|uniref:Uncharacterized protein n=1 Tax=Clitoria ternatea TaxID=43366 RepID=A0AAN9PE26_CLITE